MKVFNKASRNPVRIVGSEIVRRIGIHKRIVEFEFRKPEHRAELISDLADRNLGAEISKLLDFFCRLIEIFIKNICGKLDGNVYVKDTLGLKEGCTVNGNLNIRRISVELGSVFNGNCKMINEGEFDKLSGVKPAAAPVAAPQGQQHAAPAN